VGVLLTKDKNIRRRPLEVEAILSARVRAFVLTATDLTGPEQANAFVKALQRIVRLCQQPGPFVYNVTRAGQLSRISARVLGRRGRTADKDR
jgi:hypothetical protein